MVGGRKIGIFQLVGESPVLPDFERHNIFDDSPVGYPTHRRVIFLGLCSGYRRSAGGSVFLYVRDRAHRAGGLE